MTACPASASTSASSTSGSRPTVGVLGIGIMGSAIGANLVKAGFPVIGYDPLPTARAALTHAGGTAATTPEDAIRPAKFLILCLPSDAALAAVARQIAAVGTEGLTIAETSTLTPPVKQQAADLLAARGITLLDCPLSGTGAQALDRDPAVYASGDPSAIQAMQPVFDGFARTTYNIGAFGNGMRMKLMANLLVAIHNISTAEALLMGQRMGMGHAESDTAAVYNVLEQMSAPRRS